MPHAFNPHPKHPAVDYLVRLHADLGGQIQVAKAQAERLASDARHVEAVIRMFDPDYNVRAIAARMRKIPAKLAISASFESRVIAGFTQFVTQSC